MNEHPILFSGEMVRAILDGRKTQTRRVIKPQPLGNWDGWIVDSTNRKIVHCASWFHRGKYTYLRCPYGWNGDRLWVRETWRIIGWWEGEPFLLQYSDNAIMDEPGDSSDYDNDKYIQYYIDCTDDCTADGIEVDEFGNFVFVKNDPPTRWRPSIFMPRWASRITLEITGVRVERVQDISKDDVLAEGIKPTGDGMYWGNQRTFMTPVGAFAALWDGINAKRGFGWDENPWVWVIEFRRMI